MVKGKVLSLFRVLFAVKQGGEARDLKLEIPGITPIVRIYISLIFS